MSTTIGIRVNEDEKQLLSEIAAMYGGNISKMIKSMVFERIEDEYDLKVLMDFEEKEKRGEVKLLSHDEFWDRLGV